MALILIVDDAKFSRLVTGSTLKAEGYEVIEAENGSAGVEKTIESSPDLIITDLLMPVMDGVELIKTLREKKINTPILVLTSNIQKTIREKCMELGATNFMNKPPSKQELKSLVREILQNS